MKLFLIYFQYYFIKLISISIVISNNNSFVYKIVCTKLHKCQADVYKFL